MSIFKDNTATFLCTKTNTRSTVRQEVNNYVEKTSTWDDALDVTFMKSDGPILKGGSEMLQLFTVERNQYANPDALESDDIY